MLTPLQAKECTTRLESLLACNTKIQEFEKKHPELAGYWVCRESIHNLCGETDKIFCSTEKFKICEMYFEDRIDQPRVYRSTVKSTAKVQKPKPAAETSPKAAQ